MSWGKIYCDTNWGENKYRTAGSIINEATPDCFQFPEFVTFKDHVRSEGATYEKMQCGIDILLFLGRSISITPQSPLNPTFSGILDTYTGATAGYSTRRLTNTYTGGLIRVRRSSDDSEQDIGYDANGEDMDIFGLLAFVGTSGTDYGYVTTFYDQTGNGNHATNSTASEQPLIVDGGSIIYSGATISRPAIDFDGVDDKLGFESNLNIGVSPSIIGVLNIAVGDIAWRAGGSDYWYFQLSQIFRYRNGDFDTSWVNSDGLPIVTGSQKLIATYKNSTSVELSVDGTSIATKSSGTGTDGAFNHIGSNGLYMDGVWQELIIFTSDQSTNRPGIEGNINTYFSIYTP